MDGNRFDDLARLLAGGRTRRGVLRGFGLAAGLGAVGAVAPDGGAATTCRPGGAICRKPDECCSGTCGPKDATGRERCACAAGTTPCGTSACCGAGQLCIAGTCRQPTPTTPPDLARDCAPDADICIQVAGATCAGDHCSCLQRIGGAGVICAEGGTCQPCDEDADCGPGRYCVTTPGNCCGGSPTACYSPCQV
jgi:hypothetical protein